jgi:hypothetical protein
MTLKIESAASPEVTVFTLSGRMEAEHIAELERLFKLQTGCRNIVVDLDEIRLADRDAVMFLARCEANGMKLQNCPAYIREWMERERR